MVFMFLLELVFLAVCFVRLYFNHFTREHHFGFEAAAWYWHFVDVVWLFLFLTIYWWVLKNLYIFINEQFIFLRELVH